ncbi:hypothetical protein PV749_17285 [Streptomyces sp. ID03-2B]|uniref:hypothetical protein n=1 Tax=Streptomyces sp. ID03-2B TaxID=3028660 RepID=UPI0029A2AB19|nr:hypothetical protein [Streptomyces sp. ID03-2B]MDX3592873.1 hypothetical protein [Streptomyces sp. ID03-2B]
MAGEGAGAGRTVAETVDADRIVRRPAGVSGETAGGFPGAALALVGEEVLHAPGARIAT